MMTDMSSHAVSPGSESVAHSPMREAVAAWLAADVAFRDAAREVLRAEVIGAVKLMRAAGVAPERVLVRMKSEIREACSSSPDVMQSAQRTDGIVSDVVQWSIVEYYRSDALAS